MGVNSNSAAGRLTLGGTIVASSTSLTFAFWGRSNADCWTTGGTYQAPGGLSTSAFGHAIFGAKTSEATMGGEICFWDNSYPPNVLYSTGSSTDWRYYVIIRDSSNIWKAYSIASGTSTWESHGGPYNDSTALTGLQLLSDVFNEHIYDGDVSCARLWIDAELTSTELILESESSVAIRTTDLESDWRLLDAATATTDSEGNNTLTLTGTVVDGPDPPDIDDASIDLASSISAGATASASTDVLTTTAGNSDGSTIIAAGLDVEIELSSNQANGVSTAAAGLDTNFELTSNQINCVSTVTSGLDVRCELISDQINCTSSITSGLDVDCELISNQVNGISTVTSGLDVNRDIISNQVNCVTTVTSDLITISMLSTLQSVSLGQRYYTNVSLPRATIAGELLVLYYVNSVNDDGTLPTTIDVGYSGDTWIEGARFAFTTVTHGAAFFYRIADGGEWTIPIVHSSSNAIIGVSMYPADGGVPVLQVPVVTTSNASAGPDITVGPATATGNGVAIAIGTKDFAPSETCTWDSFTERQDEATNSAMSVADSNVVAGSVSDVATWSGADDQHLAFLAIFDNITLTGADHSSMVTDIQTGLFPLTSSWVQLDTPATAGNLILSFTAAVGGSFWPDTPEGWVKIVSDSVSATSGAIYARVAEGGEEGFYVRHSSQAINLVSLTEIEGWSGGPSWDLLNAITADTSGSNSLSSGTLSSMPVGFTFVGHMKDGGVSDTVTSQTNGFVTDSFKSASSLASNVSSLANIAGDVETTVTWDGSANDLMNLLIVLTDHIGVQVDISGSSAGVAVATSLGFPVLLESQSDGASTVGASVNVLCSVAGLSDGAASVSEAIEITRDLITQSSGSTTITSTLSGSDNIQAQADGFSTVTSDIVRTRDIQIQADGASDVISALDIVTIISAQVDGVSTVVSNLNTPDNLQAQTDGASAVVSELDLLRLFTAQSDCFSTAGAFSLDKKFGLDVSLDSGSSVIGGVDTQIDLVAQADGGSALGSILGRLYDIQGTSTGVAASAAVMMALGLGQISASSVGISTVEASLAVSHSVASTSEGVATVASTLDIHRIVSGVSDGTSSVAISARRIRGLSGESDALTAISASVSKNCRAVGQVDGVANVSSDLNLINSAIQIETRSDGTASIGPSLDLKLELAPQVSGSTDLFGALSIAFNNESMIYCSSLSSASLTFVGPNFIDVPEARARGRARAKADLTHSGHQSRFTTRELARIITRTS